jgi:hypothetical protein
MAKPIRIFLVPRMSKSFFLIWQLKERCPPLPSGLVGWGRTKGSCLGLVADQANLLNILTEYSINSCYLRLNCHFDILRLKKGTASFRFLFQHKSVCIIGIFPFSQCNRSPGKAICPHNSRPVNVQRKATGGRLRVRKKAHKQADVL